MRDPEGLIRAATEARERAIAPYSRYTVGAALRTAGGTIVRGCNIENATYGLTMCAERVALFTALAAGERAFDALAVVSPSAEPATPCGPCRQLLWEYCGDLEIAVANPDGETRHYRLARLLPHPFTLDPEER